MNKRTIIALIVLIIGATVLLKGYVQAASTLQFAPSAKTVAQNSEFSVSLSLQADQAVYAADAVVLYTTADLEVVSAVKGDFFDTFSQANDIANGRLELHGYFLNSTADAKSGSGTFATVTFKAKRGSGTGTVSFACTPGGSDTLLVTPGGTNILTCSTLNTLTVSYTGTNPTPTPTVPVGGPNPTSTPTPGPRVNNNPSCTGISYLPASGITTFSTVTIYCQGTDQDGYLNGSQFDFGDGNTRIVSASSTNGKISTTYRYAKPGTYGASCIVRDNSGAWSNSDEICKTKVSVVQGISGGTGSTGGTFVPTPTSKPYTGVPTPTPTIPEIVMTDFVSPTPFVAEEPPEEETAAAEENPIQSILLYAGGGIIIVAVLIFLARKLLGGPPQNPPVIMPPTNY